MPSIIINEVDNSLYANTSSTQPTIACCGPSTTGPFNTPTLCSSITEFTTTFGFSNTEGSQTYSYVSGILASGISVLFTRVKPDNIIEDGVSVNPISQASATSYGVDLSTVVPVSNESIPGITGSGYVANGTLANPNVIVGGSDQDVAITATVDKIPMTIKSGEGGTILLNGVATTLDTANGAYVANYASMTFQYLNEGVGTSVSLVASKIIVIGSDIRVLGIISIEDAGAGSGIHYVLYDDIYNIAITSNISYTYSSSKLRAITPTTFTDETGDIGSLGIYESATVEASSGAALTVGSTTIPFEDIKEISCPVSGASPAIPGATWTEGTGFDPSTDTDEVNYYSMVSGNTSIYGSPLTMVYHDSTTSAKVATPVASPLSGSDKELSSGTSLASSSNFKVTYVEDGVTKVIDSEDSITFTNIYADATYDAASGFIVKLIPAPVVATVDSVETYLYPFKLTNCITTSTIAYAATFAMTPAAPNNPFNYNVDNPVTASLVEATQTSTYRDSATFIVPADDINSLYIGSRGDSQYAVVGTFDATSGDFSVDGSVLNMSLASGYTWIASYSYHPQVAEFTMTEKYGGTFGNGLSVSITRVVGNTEGSSPVYESASALTPREVYDIRVFHSKFSTPLETIRVTNIKSDVNYIFNDLYRYISLTPLQGDNTLITVTDGMTLSGGTDANNGLILDKLPSVYSLLTDKYTYNFTFVTAGGSYVSSDTAHGTDYFYELFNAMVELCETRGDAVAILDTPYPTSISGAKQAVSAINSSYAAAYLPWVYTAGSQADATNRWMPPSYAVMTAVGRMISNGTPLWYPIAGANRGYLSDVTDVEYPIDAVTLSTWQDVAPYINPLMQVGNQGYLIYGQKTLYSISTMLSSALESLNVRITANLIKQRIFQICTGLAFSPNTVTLWNNFVAQLDEYLLQMKSDQGLVDYRITVDTTNNTDDSIERLELNGLVEVDITRAAENINIDFVITGTGELTSITDNVGEVY